MKLTRCCLSLHGLLDVAASSCRRAQAVLRLVESMVCTFFRSLAFATRGRDSTTASVRGISSEVWLTHRATTKVRVNKVSRATENEKKSSPGIGIRQDMAPEGSANHDPSITIIKPASSRYEVPRKRMKHDD